MTALIYFGEMLVGSSIAIALLAISPFRMSSDAALLVAGVVTWTLAEYVVHCFVLHGLIPTQNALHHANKDEAVLNIFWQIWACFEAQRSDAKREDTQTSFIFAPMHFPFQAEKAHQLTGLLAIRAQPEFRERRPLRAQSL
jgi:hypothetical protein